MIVFIKGWGFVPLTKLHLLRYVNDNVEVVKKGIIRRY